jgi:hypothetical protein
MKTKNRRATPQAQRKATYDIEENGESQLTRRSYMVGRKRNAVERNNELD